MVNGIDNTKEVYASQNSANALESYNQTTSKQKKEENSDYKFDFTEEGWNTLEKGNKNTSKDEKKEKNDNQELNAEEQRKIDELQSIDKKVRIHEQAHLNAAGNYARGGVNYDYITGPDGKRYAKGGHVNIDTSPEPSPEATIRKAQIIRKAALAPAEPSPADKQMAADAGKMEVDARRELEQQQAS